LAALMGCEPLPLNPAHGQEKPLEVAIIDESVCIGCTLCIQACPVDAILGAPKRMHSILPMHCTGCALCVAPCPMDCIRMEPLDPPRPWLRADADRARARMHARKARLQAQANEDNARLEAKALAKLDEIDERTDLSAPELAKKKAVVQAAIARARARRKQTPTHQP
ncbi:MAG TPA: RnfABCDGE type electron transport complex subunit B, partial [Burkholderiaceae bacterium]|nr:RnfABCDGE type electron transport complex subunit B [Burkholderiaceae bacterium]